MDATANAIPKGIDVRGFPTLIFFPANNKKGIQYNGEREVEALANFVKEHSTKVVKEDL